MASAQILKLKYMIEKNANNKKQACVCSSQVSPASHEDSQPSDPSNTPAHIPPSPPSHNRPGDYDNNDYYLYHDDGNDNNDDDCDDDDAGDDDDDQ